VGEVVSPNAQGGNSRGAVVTMVDFASLEAQVELPERSLSQVKKGAPARVFLDAYPEHGYEGAVDRIWPTANRQKGTVEMRVKLDAPDDRLRPEMGVRVVFLDPGASVETAPQEPVVLVPESAVARIDGRTGVFELDRDVVRWREIELGARRGPRFVVKQGLTGGERLVDAPPAGLEDGARVRALE
jgi:RND family efflux transporter MFP subunit